MTASLARLVRDGVALHVDGGGPGTPVVFQHGSCGDARRTAEIFPPLPAFRRLTPECRGHGRSEAGDPTALTIATFADDVAAAVASRPRSRGTDRACPSGQAPDGATPPWADRATVIPCPS